MKPEADGGAAESRYALKRLQHDKGTWYWGVNFSRAGVHYARRFYDPMYGGNEGALAAAITWRDGKLAEVKALSVLGFCQIERSNNTSGMPGVHFLTRNAQPKGFWQARIKLADGTTRTKSFSVLRHGQRKAFRLAVAARREMLRIAQDRPYLYDPLAKRLAPRPADRS
jgi:AP2 domain